VRLANLQSGGLDLTQVAATDVDTVRKDPRLKLATVNGICYSGITINLANGERSKTPLGQDARVRQALELSIDREALQPGRVQRRVPARESMGAADKLVLREGAADPGAGRRQGEGLAGCRSRTQSGRRDDRDE
jgi:ABC-type transport system substrate-binding protein